jgi:hypothetical protein
MSEPEDITGRVRAWWDADAATYDDSSDHGRAADEGLTVEVVQGAPRSRRRGRSTP